jgi:peptidoglycan/xylan/chitin deacetylase (PgdA/CDA1 family)
MHALEGLLALRRLVRIPWLPVLTYHRVAELNALTSAFGDVVDATPAQLDRQVAFLAQHFRFIGVRDLMGFYRGGRLPPNPVMLTFDDGYAECYTEVLPILRRHNAVATFFVPTSYLEERRLFWWDRICLLLERSRRDCIELSYPFSMRLVLAEGKQRAMSALTGVVKTYAGLDLDHFLEHLARACDVEVGREEERSLADGMLLTWDQLRALAETGMEVESHTRTHRVMNTLTRQQICEELVGSRADLEAQLGRRVSALAYPVGYPVRHVPHVLDALREAGYDLAFTNHTGVNHTLTRRDRYEVRRIAMSRCYEDAYFRAMLLAPYLALSRPAVRLKPRQVRAVGKPPTRASKDRVTGARLGATPTPHK